jgi:predicted Rossmann fold nucleotide-binding protein DprA/Smf involved in DNA uptake
MDIQGQLMPKRLLAVKPPIKGLWWRGNTKLVDSEKTVAIVGSRKMSQYGKRVLAEIVPPYRAGICDYFGFVYGIDKMRLTVKMAGKRLVCLVGASRLLPETKICIIKY